MTDSSLHMAFFEVEDWAEERGRQGFPDHRLTFFRNHLEESHLPEIADASVISVFIRSQVNRHVIDSLPDLRLVATRSTGYDHVDLEACERRGVTVCYVP